MGKVVELQSEADYEAALQKGGLVVVDFFATWCGPCVAIAPKIEELAGQNPTVAFYKVDVDKQEEITALNNVSAMPTFKFFKAGKEVAKVVGADFESIKAKVASHA